MVVTVLHSVIKDAFFSHWFLASHIISEAYLLWVVLMPIKVMLGNSFLFGSGWYALHLLETDGNILWDVSHWRVNLGLRY